MSHPLEIFGQYYKPDLYESIIKSLQALGIKQDEITRKELSLFDEFHVGGAKVSYELTKDLPLSKGMKVLDVGCGLGGAARMLADEFGCIVTGIDITEQYILTARKLSKLVGLDKACTFEHGNALEMPFHAGSFDLVWTQHAQMNIQNKLALYEEIHRVLKTNGLFVYYDIFKEGEKNIIYPVPWAEHARLSHLMYHHELIDILPSIKFEQVKINNETQNGIAFLEKVTRQAMKHTKPNKGLNLLMGNISQLKLKNLLLNLSMNRIALYKGVFMKVS